MNLQALVLALNERNTQNFLHCLVDINESDVKVLECLKEMLLKCANVLNARINSHIAAAANDGININNPSCAEEGVAEATQTVENSQFLEPRGRFNVSIGSNGMLLVGKQANAFVAWQSVIHVVKVPNHASTKKEGEDVLLLKLRSPFRFNGKDCWNFVWVLSRSVAKTATVEIQLRTESVVVCDAIKKVWLEKIYEPDSPIFQAVVSKKPFLRCYHGAQDGVIYPLRCGIVFIKPLVFISNDEIASITAGRGGGSGNTKYVDLQIETQSDKKVEFTNIDRDELPSLQFYVKSYLEVRARSKAAQLAEKKKEEDSADVSEKDSSPKNLNTSVSGVSHLLDVEEGSSDEEDEDFDPDDNDDTSGDDSGDSEGERDSDAASEDGTEKGDEEEHGSTSPLKESLKRDQRGDVGVETKEAPKLVKATPRPSQGFNITGFKKELNSTSPVTIVDDEAAVVVDLSSPKKRTRVDC